MDKKYFSEKLQEALREAGLSITALSKMTGISRTSLTNYVKAETEISNENRKKIADALQKPVSYFLEDESMGVQESQAPYFKAQGMARLPIVGQVSGGEPILAVENIEGYLELPSYMVSCADYGLRVKGVSMAPHIIPGDIVLVCQQDYFEDGNTVIALIGNEVIIKKAYHAGKKTILRDAQGRECQDGESIKIIGKVIKQIRDI